jgi:hypothetical protein
MKVNISKGFTYTPKWNGNRKLPDGEQFRVRFEFVSGAEISAFLASGKKGDDFYLGDFLMYCKEVTGLSFADDDGNEKQATPEDIATNSAFLDLYLECKQAYQNETAVKKNGA